ncbi:MAG: hypothetical protein JST22_03905 [Bacteroidetes bacterium]|nr:hypothetical protein [Bacteroidota bacterium]
MNASAYTAWVEQAFFNVKAALFQRSAWEKPIPINEELVRNAMAEGMKLARSEKANSVAIEVNAPWHERPDICGSTSPLGRGRPVQHDFGIWDGNELRLACEVKWLKKRDHASVMRDLWKLALTHGARNSERDCCRTFIIIGGDTGAFEETLRELDKLYGVTLEWPPQGGNTPLPGPTVIDFTVALKKDVRPLASVLARRQAYHRHPEATFGQLRCSVLDHAWITRTHTQWKIALWELDFHSPCQRSLIDWTELEQHVQKIREPERNRPADSPR